MTEVYLFEVGGKTIIGYLNLDDYKKEEDFEGEEESGTPDMEDLPSVNLMYPAMVQYTMIPTPVKVARGILPPGHQEMSLSIQTIVSPLAVPEIVIFVDRCFGFAKVESDSYLTMELKRVSGHFFQGPEGKEGNA